MVSEPIDFGSATMAYQRFVPSFVPSRFEAQAMLIERQEETRLLQLQLVEEQNQRSDAFRAEIGERFFNLEAMMKNHCNQASISPIRPHETNFSPSIIPITPSQSPRPPFPPPDPPDIRKSRQDLTIKAPDLPDFNQSELISTNQVPNKLTLRYSCEEIHERMTNGLCIFCEDLDTPGHYNLKHKRSKICLVECVDDRLPDEELVEPAVEEISNKSVTMIQDKESNPENELRPEVSVSQFQLRKQQLDPLLMLIRMIVVPFSTLILMTCKVLELIKDKASKKRKLCKNWWFKYKLSTWLSEAFHFWKYKKQINQGQICLNGLCNELVCDKEKKRESIESNACQNHLKKLQAALEGLPQKIAGGLIYGDVKLHLKHKWRSRLECCVKNVILFTSSVKLLFPKNHKLLHYEAEVCDLKQLSTEFQSFPGLDYFAYLIFLWDQTLNCGCEAGRISSGSFSVGDVNGFFIYSKLQNGDEIHGKRLLVLNEISLLENNNKVDFTIEENWFYTKPMTREVFHLQRPPELIDLHGNPTFITKVLVQWKEHPPDEFFSSFYWQVLMLSSLRTRMFSTGEYCNRIYSLPLYLSIM